MVFKKGNTPWNKGLTIETDSRINPPSEKARRKMSESHKAYFKNNQEAKRELSEIRKGTHHSEETRRKISESNKKDYKNNSERKIKQVKSLKEWIKNNPKERKKNYEKVKEFYKNNDNARKRISERQKEYFKNNPEAIERMRKRTIEYFKNNPEAVEIIRERRVKQVFPIKDTKIEIRMQNALKERNIIFEKHKPIFGQPDIFIEPNLCIFCDGDYWHNLDKGKKRDKIVNKVLTEKGYILLRFWEHRINDNINDCIKEILLSTPNRN